MATAESDAVWLDIARNSTGAQLEKIVRLTRRNSQLDEVLLAQNQHEHRQVRAYYDEDGMFVLTARLPADLGAVIEQALRKAEGPLHEHDRDLSCEPADAARSLRDAHASTGRADALVTMAEGFLQGPTIDQPVQDHALHQVVVHVDAEVLQNSAADGRSEIEGAVAVTAVTSQRLSCDADIVVMQHDGKGCVLDVGRRTRGVSRSLKRALLERDGGCQFPGCTHRHVDAHHVRHWAQGGETKLSNLASLCRRHHRLVHEGGYRIMQNDDGHVTFLRPDGQPLQQTWPPPPLAKLQPPQQLAAGLHLDAQTAYPQWDGEPVDYDYVLDALGPYAPRSVAS